MSRETIFTVSLDSDKLCDYCERMAAEITADGTEGYVGAAGAARCRRELLESWADDLLGGSGLDRFDGKVEMV